MWLRCLVAHGELQSAFALAFVIAFAMLDSLYSVRDLVTVQPLVFSVI